MKILHFKIIFSVLKDILKGKQTRALKARVKI